MAKATKTAKETKDEATESTAAIQKLSLDLDDTKDQLKIKTAEFEVLNKAHDEAIADLASLTDQSGLVLTFFTDLHEKLGSEVPAVAQIITNQNLTSLLKSILPLNVHADVVSGELANKAKLNVDLDDFSKPLKTKEGLSIVYVCTKRGVKSRYRAGIHFDEIMTEHHVADEQLEAIKSDDQLILGTRLIED